MAELWVMRHADSDWMLSQTLSDIDRRLSETGRAQAQIMAKRMNQKSWQPEIILVSSAQRTRETLGGLLSTWDFSPARIIFEPRIYEAQAGVLQELIRAVGDDCQRLMLIGHNPSVTRLTVHLSGRSLSDCQPATIMYLQQPGGFSRFGDSAVELVDVDFPDKI